MFLINNTIKVYSKLAWLQGVFLEYPKAVFYNLQNKYPANQLYEKSKMAQ